MKKILAFVLTLAMMLTMLNVGFIASAEDEIPADAIAIGTVEQLAAMEADKVYYLTADITVGSPRTYEEVDGVPNADAVATPEVEADIITIPAGVTLYGNGYTIYSGNYITNPPEGKTSSINWSHEMFIFAAGNKITLNGVAFGDEELPIYLNARGVLTGTSDWSISMFADVEGANVEWNDVVFTVNRDGGKNGLKSMNTSSVMAKVNGTHVFNECELTAPEGVGISCGAQGGAWFYRSLATSSITMNNCVTDLAYMYGSYIAGVIHNPLGDITMNGCVNYTPLSGSYTSNGGFVSAFIGNAGKTVYMENCVNYGDLNWSNLSIGGSMVGRTNGNVSSLIVKDCVNYGNLKAAGDGADSGNHGFGGIVGHVQGTYFLVENCVNYGNIAGTGHTGGIVGRIDGAETALVKGCVNYGNITKGASKIQQAAGIVAQNNTIATIEDCTNYGSVKAGSMSAGILGNTFNTGDATTMKGCVNYGAVHGSTYAGGFVAHTTAGDGQTVTTTFINSVNYGKITTGHTAGGFIAQVYKDSTVVFTNCLNAGTVGNHASNEGIGGFIGRVANTNAVITLTECANIGTIKGSSKVSPAYGSFGDTFGQFIGLYTVNAMEYNYAENLLVGGFVNWNADSAVKPVLTNCYAYGQAIPAEGAKSLTGWITKDEATGEPYGNMNQYLASTVPVTEAPNNGAYGINVQISADSTEIKYVNANYADVAAAFIAEKYSVDLIAGDVALGEAPIVNAIPAIRAYQMSLDGSAIRVLATVDSSKYENIGFVYSALVNDEVKAENKVVTSNYVMKAVNAVTGVTGTDPETGDPIDGDVLVTMTAEEIGGQYVTAITFRNVPAEGYAIITVAPTAGEYVGVAYTIIIMDGVVVSCTAA